VIFKKIIYYRLTITICLSLFFVSNASALTQGETYTITVEKFNSDGTVTSGASSLGLSTTAVADSDGKISFSMSGIPDNSTCNFLLVTVKDSGNNVVRRSIVPCPGTGNTLPAGISGITAKQTDALIQAAQSAGTDDPILFVFGFAIVRSTGITSSELVHMANFAQQGINGNNGFVDYLTNNGVTASQLITYRQSIVSRLADSSDGYSKLIKESVDAATTAEELNARGEAASKLLRVLVEASTTAGFSQDRVLEAFNAMGAIVVPLMQTAITNGDITAKTQKMIDSSIGGGIMKLKADRDIEKYSAALTTLGASGSDVTNYQNAANTLLNAMVTAFKNFEQVFDGTETEAEIQSAQSTFETAMQAAFDQFITDTSAPDARITTMIANIDSALGQSTGLAIDNFKYYKSDGTEVNWPLTMVILTDFVSSVVSAGGEITYTRDTTNIPTSITWLGTCSGIPNADNYYDKNSCEGAGGTWTPGRTNFGPGGQDIPTSYASIFGIQEDVQILEFVRMEAQQAAGNDMAANETLEKNFSDSLASLTNNIGGTLDGSTPLSSTIKSAIITLMKSPQF
jgi:hypothetical protein